jgi:hypothetical protein
MRTQGTNEQPHRSGATLLRCASPEWLHRSAEPQTKYTNEGARNAKRIKLKGTPGPRDRFLGAALAQQPGRKSDVCTGVVRIQLDGALVLGFRAGPLPVRAAAEASPVV